MYTKRFSLNGLGLAIIGLGLLSGCGSANEDNDEPLGEAQLGILSAPTARSVATGSDHTPGNGSASPRRASATCSCPKAAGASREASSCAHVGGDSDPLRSL
jgi:hypothetical protein